MLTRCLERSMQVKETISYGVYRWGLGWLPATLQCSVQHSMYLRHVPNLRHPQTFNELLLQRKLLNRGAELVFTSDKLALQEFVRGRLGSGYSPSVYRVFPSAEAVSYEGLPSRFLLKTNHGSGANIVVSEIGPTVDEARRIMRSSVRQNYYWYAREWPYRFIQPRVYAEELLGEVNAIPPDYKLFTFGGVVRMIQVDLDRHIAHKRALMTPDWRTLNVSLGVRSPSSIPAKPRLLSEMIRVAQSLGEGFDFVRIDLYEVGERVLVGEMTHFPGAALERFSPRGFDLELGEVWRNRRPISEGWCV